MVFFELHCPHSIGVNIYAGRVNAKNIPKLFQCPCIVVSIHLEIEGEIGGVEMIKGEKFLDVSGIDVGGSKANDKQPALVKGSLSLVIRMKSRSQ